MKTKTQTKTALSALFLLAVAALMPACDILNPNPCDPSKEICPLQGHPDTLKPN